ncbi:MAG: hypothetical protein LBF91_06710 [Azoarcus sp.]|nr:hypothetical protein [Azoarcus sp.]
MGSGPWHIRAKNNRARYRDGGFQDTRLAAARDGWLDAAAGWHGAAAGWHGVVAGWRGVVAGWRGAVAGWRGAVAGWRDVVADRRDVAAGDGHGCSCHDRAAQPGPGR